MISGRRALEAAVLGAWASLFWFLMFTGRTPLYLSSRTGWIVPVGAVFLTVTTLGRCLSLRSPSASTEELTGSRAWGALVLIVPVVLVLALPPTSLGAFAASRRNTLASGGISSSAEEIAEGEITLIDVAGALRDPEAMRALRARAGDEVEFTGFVTKDDSDPAGSFTLNRFIISCCVADALAVKVRVVGAPPGLVAEDDWVRAGGKLFPLGDEVALDASGVEKIERPSHPYLDP